MTVSPVAGVQEPRIRSVPPYETTLGADAVELARKAGLNPDPWQAHVLEGALGQRADGQWSAFEVGVNVPRQNGKGGLIEMRQLAGLFLLEERLQIHSAHNFDTSLEAFRRLLFLIEDTPELDMQVKRVSRSHGDEGLELKGDRRIRFRTRTKGGGRGFACDTLYLDEAMFIALFMHGALLPTLAARPKAQVWYLGSAVDQMIHDDGIVFSSVRERGQKGGDPSLAYFEWSVPDTDEDGDLISPALVDESVIHDLAAWGQANPALGIRIQPEHVENEARSMDTRTFAVERLGIGDWPPTDPAQHTVVSMELWGRLADLDSRISDRLVLALDVAPSRQSACIGAAGKNGQAGVTHLEVADHRQGTGWIVERSAELWRKHRPLAFLVDERGPAASFIKDLRAEGVKVTPVNASDYAKACGTFYDLTNEEQVRHLGTTELRAALKGAKTRPLGDAWAWARKLSAVDITPLVACTLALWAAAGERSSVYEDREVVAV